MEKPLKFFLKYAVKVISVHTQNSIQAGLRGGTAMTSIEELDIVISEFCDAIAMEIDNGDAITLDNDFSVAHSPILAVGDGFVHFALDDPHVFSFG
jgi:hypothetical protein